MLIFTTTLCTDGELECRLGMYNLGFPGTRGRRESIEKTGLVDKMWWGECSGNEITSYARVLVEEVSNNATIRRIGEYVRLEVLA